MGTMTRDEFEHRLKELVVKIDCRIAADALLEEAKRQYLRYAAEAVRRKGAFLMSCPSCGSPRPNLHPSSQSEGEVSLCRHPFHGPPRDPGPFSIGSTLWAGTSKLIEETGELQQVLGKLIAVNGDAERHWSGNLREKLIDELGDVMAALSLFSKLNMTDEERNAIDERASQKLALFERWQKEQSS